MMVEEVARFFDPWGAQEAQQQAQPQGEAIGAPAQLLPAFSMLLPCRESLAQPFSICL